jgi:hypothetical protein
MVCDSCVSDRDRYSWSFKECRQSRGATSVYSIFYRNIGCEPRERAASKQLRYNPKMDTRSIINLDEDGIFHQWKALHYIECDLSSKTILDTDGQAIQLSRVSFLIEGNIPKFLDAMGVDDHGNINTKEARNCAANILANRPYWTNQQKIDGKFLPLNGQYVDVTRLGGGSPSLSQGPRPFNSSRR